MKRLLLLTLIIGAISCSDMPFQPKIVCTPAKPDTLVLAGHIITSPSAGHKCGPKR